jgi:chorismate-pyruvate lyase
VIAAAEPDLLYPLSLFCRENARALPVFTVIEGAEMPDPYRTLLVHRGDMTSRLESHFGSALRLRVLHREATPSAYRREVLLCTEKTSLPVEYGAIEINLTAFPDALRAAILEARQPLGGLLNSHGFAYRSEPRAFFRLAPDEMMNSLFDTSPATELYGRSNVLLGENGETLARIVEVLRPLGNPGS